MTMVDIGKMWMTMPNRRVLMQMRVQLICRRSLVVYMPMVFMKWVKTTAPICRTERDTRRGRTRTTCMDRGDVSPLLNGATCRARAKLIAIHAATVLDFLWVPPANHLEALKDDRKGQWSIRINDQWRICFAWPPVVRRRAELAMKYGRAKRLDIATSCRRTANCR
ncbi:MAG: type II toxin-antitoxin system RelE/ParE family toxin [Gammaproteobacteria bacterium]